MKIKKALNIPSPPLEYVLEGEFLYALFAAKSSGQVVAFCSETLDPSGQFMIPEGVSSPQLTLHEDYVYAITENGITGYDSFSGDPLIYISTGSCIPLSFSIKNEHIFSFCGIPIVNRTKVDTNSTCICLSDLQSGKKMAQSASVEGQYQPAAYGNEIWAVGGQALYQFNPTCELRDKKILQIVPDYPITLTENYATSASSLGTLEIFSRSDLSKVSRILVEKNSSPPIACDNDRLVWFTGKHLYMIDLSSLKISRITEFGDEIKSTPAIKNNYLYVSGESGTLFKINIDTGDTNKVRLAHESMWKPVITDEYVFIASDKILYQVEI